ncbi:hypothetical protein R5R35_003644 [Gryllus longicercus]|uniref:Cytosol aminopeptidase n=1 Tax=Gryllus longicercus TaxID=2509291 RepID=A0AAN9W5K2_9ORTH
MAYLPSRMFSHLKYTQYVKLFGNYRSIHSKNGLVLGVYSEGGGKVAFTKAAERFNEETKGKLQEDLSVAGPTLGKGKSRIFYNLTSEFPVVSVVGLGNENACYNEEEQLHEDKEAVRVAAGVGAQQLLTIGVTDIFVEDLGDPQAAAEGAGLGVWKYQGFRNKAKQKPLANLELYCGDKEKWSKGLKVAEAQNLARQLMDTPANHMTPTLFAKNAVDVLTPLGVDVCVRDKAWAEELKMGSFLSVAKGSNEPPVFLEISYSGGDREEKPTVLIGKGVTFDSGGISIKSASAMDEMRADMGGAACVVGAIYGAASLKMPLNVVGLIPLCENMPSGGANKPGDVVTAMNGKTIQIDNTDAEGRLILADALCYSEKFQGQFIIDIATLTGAIRIALGNACTGAYTTSTARWKQLEEAGSVTGDRFWRMPLWKYFSSQVTDFPAADVNNVSKLKMAGSCTAAAFLKEFAPKVDWMHLDIAGVMGPAPCDGVPYLVKGMTGRPTRALIHLLALQC